MRCEINHEPTVDEITFCTNFYSNYDTNFYKAFWCFSDSTTISYLNYETVGVRNLINAIEYNNITSFQHSNIMLTSQKLGNGMMLLVINGLISFNNLPEKKPFTDVIILDVSKKTVVNYVSNV